MSNFIISMRATAMDSGRLAPQKLPVAAPSFPLQNYAALTSKTVRQPQSEQRQPVAVADKVKLAPEARSRLLVRSNSSEPCQNSHFHKILKQSTLVEVKPVKASRAWSILKVAGLAIFGLAIAGSLAKVGALAYQHFSSIKSELEKALAIGKRLFNAYI